MMRAAIAILIACMVLAACGKNCAGGIGGCTPAVPDAPSRSR